MTILELLLGTPDVLQLSPRAEARMELDRQRREQQRREQRGGAPADDTATPPPEGIFFRPPTHFSHMSHPTFPISHILILFF